MSGKVNLDRWTPHLAAARREGKTLTQYARSRGLSRHTLYAARQMLRCLNGKPAAERRPRVPRAANTPLPDSAFAAVKLSAPSAALRGSAPRLQARLANGVMLELTWGGADATLLAAAIQALAGR
jgi:hypothetical protein